MASIRIALDTRRANAKGLYPIKFIVSHKSVSTSIGTGTYIKPEHWNGEVNKAVVPKCPNARAINESIEALFFRYTNTIRKLDNNEKSTGFLLRLHHAGIQHRDLNSGTILSLSDKQRAYRYHNRIRICRSGHGNLLRGDRSRGLL